MENRTPISVINLNAQDATATWAKTEPILLRGVERSHGEMTMSSLKTLITLGNMQLWIVLQENQLLGVLVTETVQYPSMRSVRVVIMAGERLRLWAQDAITALHAFAFEQRATRIEAVGRRGLAKVLDSYGFKNIYTTLALEVPYGQVSGK